MVQIIEWMELQPILLISFGGGWEKVTPTIKQLPFKGDTVIGNDVWIGQNVTIMPGVKVGDGAIIAANSTVVKNIEPYTIYGGNPAKFIKKRFSDEKVEFLLNLQWWNWDEEKIFNNLEMLTSETDNFWNEENLNERKTNMMIIYFFKNIVK